MTKAAFYVRLRRLGTVGISASHSNEPATVYDLFLIISQSGMFINLFLIEKAKCLCYNGLAYGGSR